MHPLRFPPACLPTPWPLSPAVCCSAQAAVEAVAALHREDLPGDVLVFLTGQDECEAGKQAGRRVGRRLTLGGCVLGRSVCASKLAYFC